MKTINEHIQDRTNQFRQLSASRKSTLRREAERYIRQYPHMADSSNFWRGLSARQVIAAYHSAE